MPLRGIAEIRADGGNAFFGVAEEPLCLLHLLPEDKCSRRLAGLFFKACGKIRVAQESVIVVPSFQCFRIIIKEIINEPIFIDRGSGNSNITTAKTAYNSIDPTR